MALYPFTNPNTQHVLKVECRVPSRHERHLLLLSLGLLVLLLLVMLQILRGFKGCNLGALVVRFWRHMIV